MASSSGFDVPLDLRAHARGEWTVLVAITYATLGGQLITIPRGFVTDLASIPRVLRPVFDQNDDSRQAAVLHDWLYCSRRLPRADADGLFLEALQRAGIGWLRSRVMWLGVRSGGWLYWGSREGLTAEDFALPG